MFTDGSKSEYNTSFAVTEENGNLIKTGILWEYSSIFTTEAFAIHEAAKTIPQLSSKLVICTDSLSVVRAVSNPNHNSKLINNIRDLLIRNPNKIKLMWVPSHIGILGNEYADNAAKACDKSPIFTFDVFSKKDLQRFIDQTIKKNKILKWSRYENHYSKINIDRLTPIYPPSLSRATVSKFIRLRLGHTISTHQHILRKENSPVCPVCNNILNISHILGLSNCSISQQINSILPNDQDIFSFLNTISIQNIVEIEKYIILNKITI